MDTIEFLENNKKEYLSDLRLSKVILNRTHTHIQAKALNNKGKIDKLECIKIKNICLSRNTSREFENKPLSRRKYLNTCKRQRDQLKKK